MAVDNLRDQIQRDGVDACIFRSIEKHKSQFTALRLFIKAHEIYPSLSCEKGWLDR